MTRYLKKKKNKWVLVNQIKDKYADYIVEIKEDELIVIFVNGNMQVFTSKKEQETLDLRFIEKNYKIKGKIYGKVDDMFVYKKGEK